MFRLHSRSGSGGRQRLGLGVALAAVVLAVAAPAAQAAPFAYVTNSDDREVAQYDVGAGGLLSPLSPFTVDAVGRDPDYVAISPDRKSVYVGNTGQLCDCPGDEPGSIAQYDIGADGTLSPKTPGKVQSCGSTAGQVAVSPNGRSLYVTGGADCSSVLQYDIDADGALSPPAFVDVNNGNSQPVGVAVSPDSQSVYVTNYGRPADSVYQYDVGAGGALIPKSPPAVAAGSSSLGVAVTPDGQSVYVTNPRINFGLGSQFQGTVTQYDVGAGGALTPKSPPTVPAGFQPNRLALSPDGTSAYVVNRGEYGNYPANGSVSQYDIDPVSGALSPKSPPTVSAGASPAEIAVSPDGQSAYVTNHFDGNVSQYDIGGGGELSAKGPATVAAGLHPTGIAVRPLVGGPTTQEQCKDGGRKEFGFKSLRQCIRFVKNRARKSCRDKRDEIGRPAFREKYGKGKHHRRAMPRCVKQTISAR